MTGSAGWLISSDTFYPFGQEQSTTSDANHYKFTGKERDTESGLDYFGARFYGSNSGRFISPDPSQLAFADPGNPQSFNLYSYVLNNPVRLVDPFGLQCSDTGATGNSPSSDAPPACSDQPAPPPCPTGSTSGSDGNCHLPTATVFGSVGSAFWGMTQLALLQSGAGTNSSIPRGSAAPSNLMFAQGTGERGQTSKPNNPTKGVRPVVKNGKVVGWTIPDNQTGKRIPKSLDWGRSNGLNNLDPKWVAMGTATGVGAMTLMEILEMMNALNEVGP